MFFEKPEDKIVQNTLKQLRFMPPCEWQVTFPLTWENGPKSCQEICRSSDRWRRSKIHLHCLKVWLRGGGRLWGAWYKLPVQFFGELGALGQNVGTIVIQFAIFAGPFLDVGPRASRCGQTQSCKTLKTFGWETKQDNLHLRKCEALLQQYHAICHLQFVLASYKWVEYRHFIPTSSSAPCEVRDH